MYPLTPKLPFLTSPSLFVYTSEPSPFLATKPGAYTSVDLGAFADVCKRIRIGLVPNVFSLNSYIPSEHLLMPA